MSDIIASHKTFSVIADDLSAAMETLDMLTAQLPTVAGDERARIEAEAAEVNGIIERIGAELMTKTDNIAGVLRRLDAEAEWLKAESDRLAKRRKTYDTAADWLKSYTITTIRANGWDRVKTTANTLFIRRDEKVDAPDANVLPDEYCRIKTLREADRIKLKAALRAGAVIPGAVLRTTESLQVR